MPTCTPHSFPGRETYGKDGWWTAKDDNGDIRTFKWDYRWNQCPTTNSNGMTGMAIEWPMIDCRLHVCATTNCPARHNGCKRGLMGPCEHVRFTGWAPTEEAATGDAVSSGGVSAVDVLVDPSSAMGAGIRVFLFLQRLRQRRPPR